jgi:hypothetical protein
MSESTVSKELELTISSSGALLFPRAEGKGTRSEDERVLEREEVSGPFRTALLLRARPRVILPFSLDTFCMSIASLVSSRFVIPLRVTVVQY